MPVLVDISYAEMTSARLNYSTQRLTPMIGRIGGYDGSDFNRDRGVAEQGGKIFRGSNTVMLGDRGSVEDSAYVESLLMRMLNPGYKFACPVLRPNDAELWTFTAIRNGVRVPLDRDLVADSLDIVTGGVNTADGYTATVRANLKTPNAALTSLQVSAAAGALCSVGGKLFMVTDASQGGLQVIRGLLPRRALSEITSGAKLDWRNPWIGARIPPRATVTYSRSGSNAGPWNYEWEEVEE